LLTYILANAGFNVTTLLVLTKFAFVWQEYRPLMDWKVVAAAPLVIENQLPVKGTYLIWWSHSLWW